MQQPDVSAVVGGRMSYLYYCKIGNPCSNQMYRQWLEEGCRTYITVKLETCGVTIYTGSG